MDTIKKVDLLIIGAGINGMAIAGMAARAGVKVAILEKQDLASGTSSKSTQLIHGGLRYLQQYHFGLVKKSLDERTILMKMAPHLVQPLEFIIPDYHSKQPHWLVRLGLFAYDYLSLKNPLKKSHAISLTRKPYQGWLKPGIARGLVYSDAWTQDSRLVVEWALLAKQYHADILTYHTITEITELADGWCVQAMDNITQSSIMYQTKIVINATGPWVESFAKQYLPKEMQQSIHLVKGSHLVLKQILPDDKAYLLECTDGRIIFLTPYAPGFCLLGTTEVDYQDGLDFVTIQDEEINYLLHEANRYLQMKLSPKDIVHTFSGVRPLIEDGKHSAHEASRDYQLKFQLSPNNNGLVTILGGKLTTHRRLAVEVMQLLKQQKGAFTQIKEETFLLPGASDMTPEELRNIYPFLPKPLAVRYFHSYGTLCHQFLQGKPALSALGQDFGAGLYQAEVDYLLQNEWVKTVEDLLWRRSRLGLWRDEIDLKKLREYIDNYIELRD